MANPQIEVFSLHRSEAGGFFAVVTTGKGQDAEKRMISYANEDEAIAGLTGILKD